jgi:hypothetical protein
VVCIVLQEQMHAVRTRIANRGHGVSDHFPLDIEIPLQLVGRIPQIIVVRGRGKRAVKRDLARRNRNGERRTGSCARS